MMYMHVCSGTVYVQSAKFHQNEKRKKLSAFIILYMFSCYVGSLSSFQSQFIFYKFKVTP